MDKVELTREDITALIDWRDAHKDLVRSLPAPLKAIEICFKHNNYRIKGIREGSSLRLHLSAGFDSLGKAELIVTPQNTLIHKSGKMKVTQESFQSVLTVYCSLMALMTYGRLEPTEKPPEPRERKPAKKAAKKRPPKQPSKRITYILRRDNGALVAAPKGSHASPRGEFTVRGHYRHYASGKVVWIAEYQKGAGKKKKSKTYKMGGKKDGIDCCRETHN